MNFTESAEPKEVAVRSVMQFLARNKAKLGVQALWHWEALRDAFELTGEEWPSDE